MRDQGDMPYIVIEREGSGVGAFILGALVGAGVALLFAPQSGPETQEEIKERARQLRSAAGERMREAQKTLEERFDAARTGVQERMENVREAVVAGREAAQDARTELQRKIEQSKVAYRAGIEAAREAARPEEETGDETDA